MHKFYIVSASICCEALGFYKEFSLVHKTCSKFIYLFLDCILII